MAGHTLQYNTFIISISTRWASKPQSHSIKHNKRDTSQHDDFNSLQASQLRPAKAKHRTDTESAQAD
jgi:hypothetical protein